MALNREEVARLAMRDEWLGQVTEDIIDPGREIVDPHHHFWVREGSYYEEEALWNDTGSGHNVVQTIFIECFQYYRDTGPDHLRPVGETEHVTGIGKRMQAQPDKAQLAGIVGFADLRHPALDAVLDAHIAAAEGLFVGVRHAGSCDPEPGELAIPGRGAPGLYRDPDFRRGLARLGARGLTYDTWHYHHQMADFHDLCAATPDTTIILNHFSTPLGVGRFAGQRDKIFAQWQKDMEALAKLPNVIAKLGGLAMPDNGYAWHEREQPPTSDEFVATYAPWYHHMLDCFGAERCMFESNYPVDRVSVGYAVLWNAFKKMTAACSSAEKDALFAGTARRVYGLKD